MNVKIGFMSLRIRNQTLSDRFHRSGLAFERDQLRAAGRLSSGLALRGAADDAAGTLVAARFRAQVAGLAKASENGQDAVNLLRVAEGSLADTTSLLQRMRELVVRAANDSCTTEDRTLLKAELDALSVEVDGVADRSTFNEMVLLTGEVMDTPLTFQIGAHAGQTLALTLADMRAFALYVAPSDLTIASHDWAAYILTNLDNALGLVANERGKIGALTNRVEHAIENMSSQIRHAAESLARIRDADFATEASNLVRSQMLARATLSMQAQANHSGEGLLTLLHA